MKPPQQQPGKAKPADREQLSRALVDARSIADRIESVKQIRAVWATIKKKKLADLGDLVVEQIVFQSRIPKRSHQDALQLLAYLGRADLLALLLANHRKELRGYADWVPRMIEEARRREAR